MKDSVAVIGAGTSGLILAKGLAQLGIDVTVYDQKEVLGSPVRASGILSINGLRSLGIEYEEAVTNTLYGATIHANKRSMHVESEEPKAHVLERHALNEICRKEAEMQGAKIILKRKINNSDLEELSKESIIVGADGAVSSVASYFKMGPIKEYLLTYRAEYKGDVENARSVDLFFDKSITPGFFGWLCPDSTDTLEVAVGISPSAGNAKAAFERFTRSGSMKGILGGYAFAGGMASMIPIGMRRRMADSKKEVLLVGDAAGQVKPSTGGGIIYGGNGAMMAAHAIYNYIKHGEGLEAYEKAYRKRYGKELMLHSAIHKAYAGLGGRGMGIAIDIFIALGVDGFLGRHGDMDMPSLMLKRLFLRRG